MNISDYSNTRIAQTMAALMLSLLLITPAQADLPAEVPAACLDWRWIALAPPEATRCPLAPGWSAQRLFAPLASGQPPGLKDYCLYTDYEGGASPAALENLRAERRLLDLGRDCVVVARQGEGLLADLQWQALEKHFLGQAGAVDGDPLGAHQVELVVVDTHPSGDLDPSTNAATADHGSALLTMAERLLCDNAPNAPCLADINSRLAFRFVTVDSDSRNASTIDAVDGGMIGSLADLAQAIQAEISDWSDAGASRRLIINLSLAWHPSHGGTETPVETMPPAARAVYAALTDASCRGVLVLAAAGNRDGANTPQSGALLPAYWETHEAPSLNTCSAALGTTGQPDPNDFVASDYRPLLYALGGVEGQHRSLRNGRPASMPRLAAFADHATVESLSAPATPTAALTGTSVATLLGSANAAVVWSWQPTLSLHQVMATLYQAGTKLGHQAELCLQPLSADRCANGVEREVSLLSLCHTYAQQAMLSLADTCLAQPQDLSLEVDYQLFDRLANAIDLSSLTTVSYPLECQGKALFHDGNKGIVGHPCPQFILPSMSDMPWVLPQPGSSMCPQCPVEESIQAKFLSRERSGKSILPAQSALRVEIHADFDGVVSDITLGIGGALYRIHPGPLVAADKLLVTGLDQLKKLDSIAISFTVNDNLSSTIPILYSH